MAMRFTLVAVLLVFGYVVWDARQRADSGVEKPGEPPPPAHHPCENPDVVGVEPEGRPDFNVDYELRKVGEQNVMFMKITESHGWYADWIYVRIRHEEMDENGKRRMVGQPINYLMKGTTENWNVKVMKWGKVLAPKPA